MISDSCRVLIAGGGTAGHVIPAVGIAKALYRKGVLREENEVHFVGSKRGVGREIVHDAGFEMTVLPGRGIQRKITFRNVTSILSLFAAFLRASLMIIKAKPEIIVVMGGYASLACGLAGRLFNVPLLVAEQNAVPGATNKIIARFAKVSAISFDAVELPNPVVTGNPLRSEILRFIETDSRNETRRELGVGDRKVITAFGGSLGARHLNETIFELSQNWKGEAISIYHIVGSRDWQDFSQLDRKPVRNVEYEMIEYLKDLTPLIGAADLVISRAGATSVSEITALGIPSILVPLPNSPGGHQEENARFFEREGSAIVVRDSELNYVSLSNRISLLLTEDLILKDMAKKAKNSRHLTGGEKIADLIFEIINGGFDGK
ncbi:MAG: undecaprenyldiphospho-muramoylpentapeptide beta-N-acetylglucosaminyltransferase [Acidimicrobiales bacterium]|jgi:UDP-N-acetylglucosamine--N-acetylmuramyl-(pentapeptide) pyrophosphoryl-undecaprenol N-acetylglucosamine transferase|nr:undecaprenyldiphospho-muramoylpentapeptide beta-N-acetylglucosaminyltransferase [Acidimicrobiales bacterium]|tara:strand:+ start:2855 stop:3985 length:1131 start_codon:yes stop_codon:yes gene_type:complete